MARERLNKSFGIHIPLDYPNYDIIVSDLDRKLYGWNGEIIRVKFYTKYDNNNIVIPRFYPLDCDVNDESEIGQKIDIKSKITPRNNRQTRYMKFLQSNLSGILRMEPGSGKTIVAIDSICKIGRKVIVFIHKNSLLNQWKKEILRFTDISSESIGQLNSTTFKKDLKKPIILSTIQAFCALLKKKGFKEEFEKAKVGIAFFDECHTTVGPEQFSLVSLNVNCKRIYGLSATPTRTDGNEDIIKYHLGNVTYYPPEAGELVDPIVYMIYFPFGVYRSYKRYMTWGGKFDLSRYHKQMFKINNYNINTSNLIRKLHNQGRNILVLGTRVNSIMNVAEACHLPRPDVGIFIPKIDGLTQDLDKSLVKAKQVKDTKSRNKKIKDIKEMKELKKQHQRISDVEDLDLAFGKKVVFSTYLACRDGNNRKSLDALVMLTPCSNVEQAVGRILRELKGKKTPLVVDLVDTEGPLVNSTIKKGEQVAWFVRQAQARYKFYTEKGWKVKKLWIK